MTINHTDFSNQNPLRRPYNVEVEESTYNTNIVETVTRNIQHSRTTIKYRLGDSTTPACMRTSELDGLSVFSLSSEKKSLFTTLEKSGFHSHLLTHLANCEKEEGLPSWKGYTFPGTKRVLFAKKDTFKKTVNSLVYHDSSDKEDLLDTQYVLEGGMGTFHMIRGYDPLFFNILLEGVKNSICRITRLDMCVDFDQDLMFLLSDSVKKGRVHSFVAKLRGYGVLNGVPFANKPLGKRSLFFQELKKKGSHFLVDTLYCGNWRYNPVVLCFYNKKKQSSAVEHQQHLDSTRVEIRLFAKKTTKYDLLINLLFQSLLTPQGSFIRHTLLTFLLFSNINFSTTQKKESDVFETLTNWAGWWATLYRVSVEACSTRSDSLKELEKALLLSLGKVRKTPQEMVSFCIKQLLKIENQRTHPTFKRAHIGSVPITIPAEPGEAKVAHFITKNVRGRPKGKKDSKSFANRGRPKKTIDSPRGTPGETITIPAR